MSVPARADELGSDPTLVAIAVGNDPDADLLLVFILENTESVRISFFGASRHLPLWVGLRLAAIGGALLTGIVGAAWILQLRRNVKSSGRTRISSPQGWVFDDDRPRRQELECASRATLASAR